MHGEPRRGIADRNMGVQQQKLGARVQHRKHRRGWHRRRDSVHSQGRTNHLGDTTRRRGTRHTRRGADPNRRRRREAQRTSHWRERTAGANLGSGRDQNRPGLDPGPRTRGENTLRPQIQERPNGGHDRKGQTGQHHRRVVESSTQRQLGRARYRVNRRTPRSRATVHTQSLGVHLPAGPLQRRAERSQVRRPDRKGTGRPKDERRQTSSDRVRTKKRGLDHRNDAGPRRA